MTVAVLTENLRAATVQAMRGVAKRSTLPVCQNILLQTNGALLELTGTDLEKAVTVTVGAQVDGELGVTLPGKLFADFVKKLPDGKLLIEQVDPAEVRFTYNGSVVSMRGTDVGEFPPIPKVDGDPFSCDAQEFKAAVQRVLFAVATDDSRPVLGGMKFDVTPGGLTLAGADGFRLAVDTLKVEGAHEGCELLKAGLIVPGATLSALVALIGKQTGPVVCQKSEAKPQATFHFGRVHVTTQLVDGTFPDYPKLIPAGGGIRMAFEVGAMKAACDSAAAYAREDSGIVRLQAQDGAVKVTALAEEMSSYSETVPALVDGPVQDARIAFNATYLGDLWQAMPKGVAVLDMTTPSGPGLFWFAERPQYRYVLMPMFVQWDDVKPQAAAAQAAGG